MTEAGPDRPCHLLIGPLLRALVEYTPRSLQMPLTTVYARRIPMSTQDNWRRCNRCMGLGFAGYGAGSCPAGGQHDYHVIFTNLHYQLNYNGGNPAPSRQDNWRWCGKCQGLAYAGSGPGVCPAGGQHDHTNSFNYVLDHGDKAPNDQADWRWCGKCQGLAYS